MGNEMCGGSTCQAAKLDSSGNFNRLDETGRMSTICRPGSTIKVENMSVVFTSADLPLRPIATIGPFAAPNPPTPIKEDRSYRKQSSPNPPAPIKEPGILDNSCHSANHFPSEEKRSRKFIQRRREREFEQAVRQKAIDERKTREAKEREVKERERRERRGEKDPREEKRDREEKELKERNENYMGM
ncbi:Uncharacterized protein APZ42_032282 [Daphnia magna]|uniref:Uncharacterized protein n=1 Tax=Daphnia magna TaxID=35525 RepID=A0A164M4B8_9CRUS|nr:Uncharacterized protein APZ42_032282 [Daphnia magna]